MSERAGLQIAARPGVCRECGCTDARACLDEVTGLGCSWVNDERTVCSVCAVTLGAQVLWMAEVLRAQSEQMVGTAGEQLGGAWG